MPNIELHGMSKARVVTIKKRLREVLVDYPWRQKVVVTDAQTSVFDLDDTPCKHIRVIAGKELLEELQQIIPRVNEDVEFIELNKFVMRK